MSPEDESLLDVSGLRRPGDEGSERRGFRLLKGRIGLMHVVDHGVSVEHDHQRLRNEEQCAVPAAFVNPYGSVLRDSQTSAHHSDIGPVKNM